MNRLVGSGYREAIAEAFSVIPEAIRDRLVHVDFLTGIDPVFAGLHRFEDASYGRSYRSTTHCAQRHHTSDKSTTIVLPSPEPPHVIVHELAHALDEVLGFEHTSVPVSWYARTNRSEAFAESFTAWLYVYGDQDVFMRDLPTRRLFEELAA